MKNTIFTLLLLATVGSNAQTKTVAVKSTENVTVLTPIKLTPEMSAKKDVAALEAFTPLTKDAKSLLLELFTTKANMLENSEQFSVERKAVVAQAITQKMESVLSADVMAKVRANAVLFNRLIN